MTDYHSLSSFRWNRRPLPSDSVPVIGTCIRDFQRSELSLLWLNKHHRLLGNSLRIAMKQTPILEIRWWPSYFYTYVLFIYVYVYIYTIIYISCILYIMHCIYVHFSKTLVLSRSPPLSYSKPPPTARAALRSPSCSAPVQNARRSRWLGPGQDRPWRSDSIPGEVLHWCPSKRFLLLPPTISWLICHDYIIHWLVYTNHNCWCLLMFVGLYQAQINHKSE